MVKTARFAVVLATAWGGIPPGIAAQAGEATFREKCVICHSPGSDRLVGPGLAGVLDRRDPGWVRAFIMGPDRMLASGDSLAVSLFEEYQIAMPNFALTDAEADGLMEFLANATPAATAPSVPPATAMPAVTDEQVQLGRDLFQGTTRLANGGPACNSCHDVTGDAVIGGGILAKELTTVFTRLGGPGVRAIIGSPPFPVMQRAYRDKPLVEAEVMALVGFLDRTNAEQAFHQPSDYGARLFFAGILGSGLIFGLFSFTWRGRLRGSVNQAIYDRQITST